MEIRISELTIDPSVMPRDGLDEPTVVEYTAAWRRGDKFPPVIVVRLDNRLVLADGWHRVESAARAGVSNVPVDMRDGTTITDVLRISLGANSRHGMRPRPQDSRRIVEIALANEELAKLSTNKLADLCGLAWATVDRLRRELAPPKEFITYTDRHGHTTKMRSRRDEVDDDDDVFGDAPELDTEPEPEQPLPTVTALRPEAKRDADGTVIPKWLADVFGDAMFPTEYERVRAIIPIIAKRAVSNPWIKEATIRDAITALTNALMDAHPHVVHQACGGRGCEMCRKSGWMPKWADEEEKSR